MPLHPFLASSRRLQVQYFEVSGYWSWDSREGDRHMMVRDNYSSLLAPVTACQDEAVIPIPQRSCVGYLQHFQTYDRSVREVQEVVEDHIHSGGR